MWDLPGPGLEPVSPALAGGLLTTVPPGKSQFFLVFASVLLLLHIKCLFLLYRNYAFIHVFEHINQFISNYLLDFYKSASSEVKYYLIFDPGCPFHFNFFSFLRVFWVFSLHIYFLCEIPYILFL